MTGMDVPTLIRSMLGDLSVAKAERYLPGLLAMTPRVGLTTVNRMSMMLAMVGEESVSLNAAEEFASGDEYNGRADLGNTEPGDGPRFKGRTFIQITGRYHYRDISLWAHAQGLVPTPTYFLDNPPELAADAYVWLGPEWYWREARPQLNALADAGDVRGATLAVNGALHGFASRELRWNVCRAIGPALLPAHPDTPTEETDVATLYRRSKRGAYPVLVDGATKVKIRDRESVVSILAAGVKTVTLSPGDYSRLCKGVVK